MGLIHEQVRHKEYGAGVITEQTESTVTVQFPEPYGVKKFLYPSAFEKFLVLHNPALQREIAKTLQKMQEQREEKQKQRQIEAEKRREEEKAAEQEQRRAAAKQKSQNRKKKESPKP